jgi:hypothetical protein
VDVIPGIYNYCDRRCERCRFADRCFQNLESMRGTDEVAAADSPESVAQIIARCPTGTMIAIAPIASV